MSKIAANEKGTTNLEYALVASLIALVSIVSVSVVGESSKSSFREPGKVIKSSIVGGIPGRKPIK